MRYDYRTPHPKLVAFVRTVVVAEGHATISPIAKPLFTNGMPALLCKTKINNNRAEVLELGLHGKSTPIESWELNADEIAIAFFFKPFVLPVLFNVPAADATKAPISLQAWQPQTAIAIHTQLSFALTSATQLHALEGLLLTQVQKQERELHIIQTATDLILANSGKEIITEVLRVLALNERTFQRIFKKFVGTTPSLFRRICQVQFSLTQLKSGHYDQLSDIAFTHGFADQSHFIRSFREFMDTTPTDYLKKGLRPKKT
jgi:AraC-like DNA-binding protein